MSLDYKLPSAVLPKILLCVDVWKPGVIVDSYESKTVKQAM